MESKLGREGNNCAVSVCMLRLPITPNNPNNSIMYAYCKPNTEYIKYQFFPTTQLQEKNSHNVKIISLVELF